MWNIAHGNRVLRNSQTFEKLDKITSLRLKGTNLSHKHLKLSKPYLQEEILQPFSHMGFGALFWLV